MKWQVMIDVRGGIEGGSGRVGLGWGGGGDQIPTLCFCSAAIKQPETVNLRNLGAVFSLLRRFHFTIINVCVCFHNCAREFVFVTSEAPADSPAPHFHFWPPSSSSAGFISDSFSAVVLLFFFHPDEKQCFCPADDLLALPITGK